MTNLRKNITVSVSHNAYYRARIWAAHRNISVSKLVSAFLTTIDKSKTALELIQFTGSQDEFIARIDKGK